MSQANLVIGPWGRQGGTQGVPRSKEPRRRNDAEAEEMEQRVWSWGAGTHGQLATGAFQDEHLPQALPSLANFCIKAISCGGAHAAAVSVDGDAATWGNGQSGQLGHGYCENVPQSTIVKFFHGINVCSVSAGWSHTAFVTESGELFTCGDGKFGQLGQGNFKSLSVPRKVEELSIMNVLMATCGLRHTLALVKSGEASAVFACGSCKRGQLGIILSEQKLDKLTRCMEAVRVNLPCRISTLDNLNITTVYSNGDHSAALTGIRELYLWGRGYNGNPNIIIPSRVCCDLRFCQVALGWNHGLALTDSGHIYAWGGNWHGNSSDVKESNVRPNCQRVVSHSIEETLLPTSICDVPKDVLKGKPHFDHNTSHCWQLSHSATCLETSDFRQAKGNLNPPNLREAESITAGVDLLSIGLYEVQGLMVVWVAAGSEHSAVVKDDGTILTWGWGEHGQLGLGTTDDHRLPQILPIPHEGKKCSSRIYCGSGFTFACT